MTALAAFVFVVVALVIRAVIRAAERKSREAAYDRAIWPEHLCSRCRTVAHEGWPGKNGGELCQLCWEAECSESWWRAHAGSAK